VQREFEEYLKCGRLEHGFLRVRCDRCHEEKLVAFSCKRRGFCPSCGARRMVESAALLIDEVLPPMPLRQWVLSLPIPLRFLSAAHPKAMGEILRVVYHCLAEHLIERAHLTKQTARTGAITFIQRFGGSVNTNIHFHMLVLDGVYRLDEQTPGVLHFRRGHAPTTEELQHLIDRIARRVGRRLERLGYLKRDRGEDQDPHFAFPDDAEPSEEDATLQALQQAAITYRIALGPNAGQKALTIQTLPPTFDEDKGPHIAAAHGFSLHAGVSCTPSERDILERLCRYISRPALAAGRLTVTSTGDLRYRMKTPWRDGTTHVQFHPLDFLARLASLVPKPRVNLVRFHGLFAPHAKERSLVTPAGRRRRQTDKERTFEQRRAGMTWAQRLARVFSIDVSNCPCGGKLKIIASIEDPATISRILNHLARPPPQLPLLAPPLIA
jgi:ribosomal protein S27E